METTWHHPFWSATDEEWVDAADLTPGTRLRDDEGKQTQFVVAVRTWTGLAEMRDLTIVDIHTYYVIAGTTAVLVHNCGDTPAGVKCECFPATGAGPNVSPIRVEAELEARLPAKYKEFMRRFGGGQFVFVDLSPAKSPDGRSEDLLSVNKGNLAIPNFVAVAPVGTGDWWGFISENGVCREEVSFLDHEDGSVQFDSADFYEFASAKGLRLGH